MFKRKALQIESFLIKNKQFKKESETLRHSIGAMGWTYFWKLISNFLEFSLKFKVSQLQTEETMMIKKKHFKT